MASISPHDSTSGSGYGPGSGPNSAPGSASAGGPGSNPVYISGPAYVSGPLFVSGAVFVSPPGPCCGPCQYFFPPPPPPPPPGPGPCPDVGSRHVVNDRGSRSTVDKTTGAGPYPGGEFASTSSPGITPLAVPDARQRFLREMAGAINAPDCNTWVDEFCAKFSAAWDQGLVPSAPHRKGKKAHYAGKRKGRAPSATSGAADRNNHHEINGKEDVSVTV